MKPSTQATRGPTSRLRPVAGSPLMQPGAGDHDVLIVERGSPLVMESLAVLARRELGDEAVAGPARWGDALEACRRSRPSVVVVEVGGRGGDDPAGLARFLADLRIAVPIAKVVAFVAARDGEDESSFHAVRAGASAVVRASDSSRRFIATLRTVAAGGSTVSLEGLGSIAERAEDRLRRERDVAARLATLTERERDVLEGLVRGLRNEEIGEELAISPRTVDKHVQHILQKLAVRSRLEAGVLVASYGVRETA